MTGPILLFVAVLFPLADGAVSFIHRARKATRSDNKIIEELRQDYMFSTYFDEAEKLREYQVYKTLQEK